jgi:hypothetical protein
MRGGLARAGLARGGLARSAALLRSPRYEVFPTASIEQAVHRARCKRRALIFVEWKATAVMLGMRRRPGESWLDPGGWRNAG